MSLLSLALWIQSTPFFTELRFSKYVYPIVLTLHLIGIALFGGAVLVTDLRLLGWTMRRNPIAEVAGQLRNLKRFGFVMVATCGILMLGSKAEEYYYNAFFRWKLLFLALIAVHALVFRGVYGNLTALDRASRIPASAKAAAWSSLLLWTGLIIMGRGIGYIQPPIDIHAKNSSRKQQWAVCRPLGAHSPAPPETGGRAQC